MRVQKHELASFSVIGRRQSDGTIILGQSSADSNRTVDSWPESMDLKGGYHTYGLEYVEIQGVDKRFYDISEVPEHTGLEWAYYL